MTDRTVKTASRSKSRSGSDNVPLCPDLFRPYVQRLAALLDASAREGSEPRQMELEAALDGQPGQELRKLYTTDSLRNTGTYFTGSRLAHRLVNPLKAKLCSVEWVIDPACGAGDLLVACARHLPVHSDLSTTLRDWGRKLAGFDVNPAFVDATRYRLALLALRRSKITNRSFDKSVLSAFFPHIRSESGLEDWKLPRRPSLIVVNPPFSYGEAKTDCGWGSGRVSQAALFIDSCVKNAAQGTRILAILPDVLRTGTRYERWRETIAEKSRICAVRMGGRFDELTQINVFLLELEVHQSPKRRRFSWARPFKKDQRTVKDLFDIRVGPVVPFRLSGAGSWFPYAHLETLPPWQTVTTLNQHIRFKGTTYKAPFVTIRRTSKSDCQFRCVGTIVASNASTAIENHLLVAIPHDKNLKTCKKLLALLKVNSTSEWMNKRICCRHLTVSSVGDLPWHEDR
jgi:N-6 DNA methylase